MMLRFAIPLIASFALTHCETLPKRHVNPHKKAPTAAKSLSSKKAEKATPLRQDPIMQTLKSPQITLMSPTPRPQPASISTIAFGSCNRETLEQPIWQAISQNRPEVFIWTGDAVYGDTDNMGELQRKFLMQKYHPAYQRFLSEGTYVLGTWDDHDYGENNSGKKYKPKAQSQKIYLDFTDTPLNDPRRQREGIYGSYLFGRPNQKVKIILLDVRYFRDKPESDGDILGVDQWFWLEQELRKNDAQVTLLVSGTQILQTEPKSAELWQDYPRSRDRLFQIIHSAKAKGVLFISGDRHFSELAVLNPTHKNTPQTPFVPTTGVPYPIWEITASGMTHVYDIKEPEHNPLRVGPLVNDFNFGMIQIDWSKRPPQLSLSIRGVANQPLSEQSFPLSALTPQSTGS